jgi:hypothetical protein
MATLELDTNDGHGTIKSAEPAPRRKKEENLDRKSRTDPESQPALYIHETLN